MDEGNTGSALFEGGMAWLKDTYNSHHFFQERDIVWTLHLYFLRIVEERGLPYRIFSGHRMYLDRQLSADLVIVGSDTRVDVAAEFKYEPDRRRQDLIAPNAVPKWPVVVWKDVEADVFRAKAFVLEERARTAYSVFIDEGGYFRERTPPPGSEWRDWTPSESSRGSLSILWSRADVGPSI